MDHLIAWLCRQMKVIGKMRENTDEKVKVVYLWIFACGFEQTNDLIVQEFSGSAHISQVMGWNYIHTNFFLSSPKALILRVISMV